MAYDTETVWKTPPTNEDPEGGSSTANVTVGWKNQLAQELRSVIGGWAKEAGYSSNAGQNWVDNQLSSLWRFIEEQVFGAGQMGYEARVQNFTNTIGGFQNMTNAALNYLGARMPFSIPEAGMSGGGGGGGGRGGGGGGGGPRPPTAAEIRQQFDVDALAERANQLSRTFLIQDHKDPRKLAQAYVETIVGNPEQKVDFDTFVKGNLKKNPRWNVIFQNKPNGIDESLYLNGYVQQALSVVGGDEANQIAFEGAALGAGSDAFGQRLRRTRAVRSSSQYVNRMEDRFLALKEVL